MTDGGDDILARIIAIAVSAKADADGRIRLPPERDLAEQLQTQRMTLRERLTVLETLGFLQRTQGRGTYLALPNSRFLQFYFEVALKLGFVSIEQVQGAMEMIGLELAANAAIHASAEDFDALEVVVAQIRTSERLDQVVERQFQFHAHLAKATGNPVSVLLIDGLSSVIREVLSRRLRSIVAVSGAFERNANAYQSVLQALRDREPDLARTAMQECYWLWRREAAKIAVFSTLDG
jgi:GntR family transcriptional regulator, transcriptional repressor for pyruvate dehydrogenase complex